MLNTKGNGLLGILTRFIRRNSTKDNDQKCRNSTNKSNEEDVCQNEKMHKRKIVTILMACYLAAFIRSLAISLQHTVFPYYAKTLGVRPQVYGYLGSCTAILQLIGGPICGRLGDIYGGRAVLIASFIALGSSYVLVLMAQTVPLLFLTRLPLFASHATQSVHIIITDITSHEERADMFGKIGVSTSIGMIIGSLAAGHASVIFGMRWIYVIATIIVSLGAGMVLILIPKDTKTIRVDRDKYINKTLDVENQPNDSKLKNDNSNKDGTNEKQNGNSTAQKDDNDITKKTHILKDVQNILRTEHFIYLLFLQFSTDLPRGIQSSMSSIIVMEYYHLEPKVNGMVLSYGSIIGIITQGFLVGLLTRYTTDANIIMLSFILLSIGSLYLIVADSIHLFCVVIVPLVVGGCLIHTIILSLITKIVKTNQTGSILGLTHCVNAIVRVISPTTGGFLFQQVGFFSFGLLGYVINSIVTIYLAFYGKTDFT